VTEPALRPGCDLLQAFRIAYVALLDKSRTVEDEYLMPEIFPALGVEQQESDIAMRLRASTRMCRGV